MDVKVIGRHANTTECTLPVGECTEIVSVVMTEATIAMMQCPDCEWIWGNRMVVMCDRHQITW